MTYNINLVLSLSAASLGMFAEKGLRKVTVEEKLSGPFINRMRDISLIAMYCLVRNQFSRSFFRNSFDILTLGVSFFHFAQLTQLLKTDDKRLSHFANLLFATYRVACRLFIMSAAIISMKDNLKELKQLKDLKKEEIAAIAALKRQNIWKNNTLFLSEYISLYFLLSRVDKGLQISNTKYLESSPRGRSGAVKLPKFLEYIKPQAMNGTRERELEKLQIHSLYNNAMPHVAITGEAGQGKTNLVGQFATLLAEKYPDSYKIVKFSKNAFGADTEWRGQEEKKCKELEDFFTKNPNYILVIDEFHVFVTYGKDQYSGRLGLADKMKEFLEKKEVRIIALTTRSEYDRYVVPDPALARRFPYGINVKGLDPRALELLRINEIERLVQDLKNTQGIHGIQFDKEQALRISKLFQDVEPCIPCHLKSPFFETLVVETVKAQLLFEQEQAQGGEEQAQGGEEQDKSSTADYLYHKFFEVIEEMISQQ